MSSQGISPTVLPGYKTQLISTKPTGSGSGYIKQKVLVKWLEQHESQVGPRWDYAVCLPLVVFNSTNGVVQIGDDVIVLAIRSGGELSTVKCSVSVSGRSLY